jgi:hypothetical protein
VTVEKAASDATDSVTVWDRKKPERDPEKEVKLPDGLMMPPGRRVTNEIDLEDWIREGERQLATYEESYQILLLPLAISLISGGIIAVTATPFGWIAFLAGFAVLVYQAVQAWMRRHRLEARQRRVDAYRKKLRDLRIPRNTEPAQARKESRKAFR